MAGEERKDGVGDPPRRKLGVNRDAVRVQGGSLRLPGRREEARTSSPPSSALPCLATRKATHRSSTSARPLQAPVSTRASRYAGSEDRLTRVPATAWSTCSTGRGEEGRWF